MVLTHTRRDILRLAGGVALSGPLLTLAACDEDGGRMETVTLAGPTMGTGYRIRIAGARHHWDRNALKARIGTVLETVNAQMSNWRAESEISRFNVGTSPAWREISRDMYTVVAEANRVHRLSGGAFDPTVGPLADLWGFGPSPGGGTIPDRDSIADTLRRTGMDHIRIGDAQPAVAKRDAAIGLDFCGIAKGFGVDRIAELLDREGFRNYLAEIGGELRARGTGPWHRPWRIGIETPVAGQRAVHRVVALGHGAIATSGNYRNFFDSGGTRYSHIIDPRTGIPVRHALASVTVIAPSTMEADALSTALMVLGPGEAQRLARREGIAAYFIVNDGHRLKGTGSPEFARYRTG